MGPLSTFDSRQISRDSNQWLGLYNLSTEVIWQFMLVRWVSIYYQDDSLVILKVIEGIWSETRQGLNFCSQNGPNQHYRRASVWPQSQGFCTQSRTAQKSMVESWRLFLSEKWSRLLSETAFWHLKVQQFNRVTDANEVQTKYVHDVHFHDSRGLAMSCQKTLLTCNETSGILEHLNHYRAVPWTWTWWWHAPTDP